MYELRILNPNIIQSSRGKKGRTADYNNLPLNNKISDGFEQLDDISQKRTS